MTALPDTFMPDSPLRRQREIPAHYVEVLPEDMRRRTVLRLVAMLSLAAAGGLWLVPVVQGDALMQFLKLALSAFLAISGALLLARTRRRDTPEVHVDTIGRRLTLVERDARGNVCSERGHAVDGLTEIVLRDNLLTARDAEGQPLLALPVSDPAVKAALRHMLAQARA